MLCRSISHPWAALQRAFARPRQRRIIIKAEVVRAEGKKPKDNPRFVITNMKQSPQWLYEEVYCQRGEIENRIKELHELRMTSVM